MIDCFLKRYDAPVEFAPEVYQTIGREVVAEYYKDKTQKRHTTQRVQEENGQKFTVLVYPEWFARDIEKVIHQFFIKHLL